MCSLRRGSPSATLRGDWTCQVAAGCSLSAEHAWQKAEETVLSGLPRPRDQLLAAGCLS